MDEKSTEKELLNVIWKNAHIAMQAISDVSPETDNEEMKRELADEYDGYERFVSSVRAYMQERGIEPKDVNFVKKTMMTMGVKMNAMKDDSRSHIAEMMIKGTVMGITELGELLSSNSQASEEVLNFANELKSIEEEYEERLKNLL